MAAVAEQESETQLCSNCQKDIPLANFTMHEIHCSRNLGICPICKESFPKSEMKSHQEQEHTQVTCKCSMKMDRGCLQEHMALKCPLRRVACQHCDLELAFNQLREHEDYCGTRTERCIRCNRNIMLKDLKDHPEDCGERAEEARLAQAKPCLNSGAALRDLQAIRSLLQAGDALPRMNRCLESGRLYNSLSGEPKEPNRRSVAPTQPAQNPGSLEKMTNTQPFIGQEPDSNLDYLLAVSLQRENSSRDCGADEIQRELWEDFCDERSRRAEEDGSPATWSSDPPLFSHFFSANALNKPKVETLLPCEFCEKLYPEEDLILHQTGCNPASALASYSKFSAPVSQHNRHESLLDLWEQLQSSRSAAYGETHPHQPDGGSLMLPCEFCGVQLEEEIIFHHQDQCDLRPATASSTGRSQSKQGAPESGERMEAPVLPQKRALRQEASPQYREEELRQERPPLSSQGSLVRGNPVATERTQLTSANSRRENGVGLSEQGKPKERVTSGRRGPRATNSPAAAAAPLPARHSSLAFSPSSYVPSFPVTAPTRPSMRGEGGQRVTQPARGNSTKAKPWRGEPEYPGQE